VSTSAAGEPNDYTTRARSEPATMREWLAYAIQPFQLAAEVHPTNCSDLYDLLANLAGHIPPPRQHLDTVCARYLLQCACIRLAAPLGEAFSRVDAPLGSTSVWAALKLINGEHWTRLPGELRALAARHRRLQRLPNRVQAHLKVHFTQPCRLTDIARDAGTSVRVMTDSFKREHSCTIHQYVSLLRLRAAIRLLIESDLKIAAICETVGWYSQADFYRHLRQFTSLSPGAARLDKSSAQIVLNRLDEWLGSRGLTA
jgi:AraC-like DNA-binding protein